MKYFQIALAYRISESTIVFMVNLKRRLPDISPVHVVLVSLLVNQLSSLFLIFFGRPKKNCPVSGNFWSVSDFFWSGSDFLVQPCFKIGHPVISEGDQFSNKAEQKKIRD